MVSADDIAEGEAFLPPAPDEESRDWPPATREIAKRWAREARLFERGLAVDDATLERVADVVMDPGYEDVGLYYTAEELDDELPIGLSEVVHEYLERRPAINGGVDFGWRDGRQVLFVGIVGDLEAHRAALTRMGGERVVLEPRPRTVAELETIEERILADEQELAAAGLEFEPPLRCCPDRGVVQVLVVGGGDEGAAAEVIAARYGAAVEVAWLGPSWLCEVPHPFASWTSEGRRVRVFFGLDHNGQQRGNARVAEEAADRVVIELTRLQPVGFVTLIGGFERLDADLDLREPVGDRAVIDASAGVARPSLARLRLPRKPRRRPPPEPPVMDTPVPTHRRRAQVWFSATDGDAVYEAMLPAGDPPLDADGEPVVRPAVRREVLEAIRRDIAATLQAPAADLELAWAGEALIVEYAGDEYAFRPGPDGLYEVGPLARIVGIAEWVEVDPPLPDGPIDTDTAIDLLQRAHRRYPTLNLIVGRLDLDVLRAALPRVTRQAIRDALDDEIAERTHGLGARLFGWHLRELERRTTDDRGWHAGYLHAFAARDRDAVLGLVPDAGERVLALLCAEGDPEARGWLAATLGPLGHRPAIPNLIELLDDPYRHVRTQAADALGALRAADATSALQRMLETERGRTDPSPPDDRMPTRRDKEAERDVRAALLAISGRRYEPPSDPPTHPAEPQAPRRDSPAHDA